MLLKFVVVTTSVSPSIARASLRSTRESGQAVVDDHRADDAGVVIHLVVDDDVITRLDQLDVLV